MYVWYMYVWYMMMVTDDQRPKNPYSKLALLSGKFLRVRKIFARMMKNCSEQPNLPGLFD